MAHSLTLQPLAGRWLKTNEATQWIRALDVREDAGRLLVRVHGDVTPEEWGEAAAESIYALTPESRDAAAFVVRFALPEHDVEVQANMNLGLLVVAAFTRGRDGSMIFTREFFHRGTGRGERWINTNPHGQVMELIAGADTLTIPDWGTVPLQRFEPDHAFSAQFDGVRVQANIKGGVLVVAYFGRGIFRREFYWREAS